MNRPRHRLFPILTLLALSCTCLADHSMVLVTRADGHLDSISPLDIRKLYLGFAVFDSRGDSIRPITNASDGRLWIVFLQDVMGMSARSYDRRLLTLTLQSGRHRPDVQENRGRLLDAVEKDQHTITFAWEENIVDRPKLKVLRVLWRR